MPPPDPEPYPGFGWSQQIAAAAETWFVHPTCPACRQPVHRVPGPDGWRLLSVVATGAAPYWGLADHRCNPPVEYPYEPSDS